MLQVTHSEKDQGGKVIGLCGPLPNKPNAFWHKTTSQIIDNIEGQRESYYVNDNGNKVKIVVIDGQYSRYIRAERDCSIGNNLNELPDCHQR